MEEIEVSAGDTVNACSPDGVAWLSSPSSPDDDADADSACSTPYYSAPSSPGRGHPGYYFSAPASPMHYVLSSSRCPYTSSVSSEADGSFEFEFSSRFPDPSGDGGSAVAGSMISADELFLNGQIRPMRPGSVVVLEAEEGGVRSVRTEGECPESGGGRDLGLRSRSLHRRARSMSPLRSAPAFGRWKDERVEEESILRCGGEMSGSSGHGTTEAKLQGSGGEEDQATATAPGSASASRSSSSSSSASSCRSSKRWVFLKDLLYRSKSEGRASGKERLWHSISFSPAAAKEKTSSLLFFSNKAAKSKEEGTVKADGDPEQKKMKMKKKQSSSSTACRGSPTATTANSSDGNSNNELEKSPRPVNGVIRKRRKPVPSPHERHYAAKRAQAEELRRRTFLPYRQGLLSCLGFSSRGYYAVNGFARTLNTVSSR